MIKKLAFNLTNQDRKFKITTFTWLTYTNTAFTETVAGGILFFKKKSISFYYDQKIALMMTTSSLTRQRCNAKRIIEQWIWKVYCNSFNRQIQSVSNLHKVWFPFTKWDECWFPFTFQKTLTALPIDSSYSILFLVGQRRSIKRLLAIQFGPYAYNKRNAWYYLYDVEKISLNELRCEYPNSLTFHVHVT